MVHFLTTARSQNIPYALRAGNIFEFGQGARSRRLQFTFTDATPLIATKLARNKVACAKLLRQAGIPVPLHFSVANEEAAVRAAQDLGYPVVVKPADLDGGKGVACGLVSPQDLRRAYRAAAALSSNLLVEKHFEGRDYRLVIMHDDLVLAIERRPASVVGTGTHTVRQLLDQMNTERAVSTVGQTARPPITFDGEAAALLASQGLHEHAVPAQGKYVRLRRAANFELGGTVQVVTEKVHPDNVRLARRAVATIGLDLAGVDLLTPDIARSWMEVGAVICEVNGQPQFGAIRSPNIYEIVLRAQVQGSGRIPVAVIAGSGSDADAVQKEIANGLRKHGLRVGLASRDQVRIDDEMIAPGPTGIFAASQALVWDRGIDALVMRVTDASVLGTGLPFDRLDLLVIGRAPSGNCAAWDDALNALHAMCRGEALSLAEADAVPEVGGSRDADSYRQIGRVMPRETIVQAGVGILVGATENQ
jgi:cyanophycin synthetase